MRTHLVDENRQLLPDDPFLQTLYPKRRIPFVWYRPTKPEQNIQSNFNRESFMKANFIREISKFIRTSYASETAWNLLAAEESPLLVSGWYFFANS